VALTGGSAVEYQVEIVRTSPLTVHFSLHNPADAEPRRVPRLLTPLGAFVGLEVRNADKAVVYASPTVKLRPKLHPDHPESYLVLDPAYTYGVMLTVGDLILRRGVHELMVSYSNAPYTGPADNPVGPLHFVATLPFVA